VTRRWFLSWKNISSPSIFGKEKVSRKRGLDDRTFEWTTGRLLGGGSSINGEQYVRPTGKVFKDWERLLGPLWSPNRAVLLFKRLEKYYGKTNNASARGYRGRIDIRQAPVNPTSMAKKLVTAIERATGFPEILDYNNPKTTIAPLRDGNYIRNRMAGEKVPPRHFCLRMS
jgi:choline dehydrogenase